jgi:hypothetical protein
MKNLTIDCFLEILFPSLFTVSIHTIIFHRVVLLLHKTKNILIIPHTIVYVRSKSSKKAQILSHLQGIFKLSAFIESVLLTKFSLQRGQVFADESISLKQNGHSLVDFLSKNSLQN